MSTEKKIIITQPEVVTKADVWNTAKTVIVVVAIIELLVAVKFFIAPTRMPVSSTNYRSSIQESMPYRSDQPTLREGGRGGFSKDGQRPQMR